MRFAPTSVPGTVVIDLEPHRDERGYFARAFCAEEFAAHGLNPAVAQENLSYNARAGTLRGLHYQAAPASEAKTVRCVRGAIFDVAVDVREDADTYLRWVGLELSADNGRALHVPEHCAHAFLTLTDDVVVTYSVSHPYTPGTERGLRWDDPAIGIAWPRGVAVISDKDAGWPRLEDNA